MFTVIILIFVLGYTAIALEHPLKIDKAATALVTGTLIWVAYMLGASSILPGLPAYQEFSATHPDAGFAGFITHHESLRLLGENAEIMFFLLGAMTIVEIVDSYGGFSIISKAIRTHNKVRLLWIISLLTFFMSAVLDNLTTTIVMVMLLRKLMGNRKDRLYFVSMVVLAANAGGAWSPIGDVTTIMLWIGGQVSTFAIIKQLFVPSFICLTVPLLFLSRKFRGKSVDMTGTPSETDHEAPTSARQRTVMLILGASGLLSVPVFKALTHLPPYMGMLLALGALWIATELMLHRKKASAGDKLRVSNLIRKIDTSTILFFLGILTAVAGLQSAGHLAQMGMALDEHIHHVPTITLIIGALSAIVDNVPLVAGAMGMYPVYAPDALAAFTDPEMYEYARNFLQDGTFWESLAYCAGTGGSMLIIGSAAGVAAMGLEKIDFLWYLRRISGLALLGYLSGAAAYFLLRTL